MRDTEYLFREGDLRATLDGQRSKFISAIGSLAPNQLLAIDDEQVAKHFIAEFTVSPIELREEELELIEPRELQVERVDRDFGERYTQKVLEFRFEIPFTGDPILFRLQPPTYNYSPPRGTIGNGLLVLTFQRADRDGAAIKTELDNALSSIRQYLGWQRTLIDSWNAAFPDEVRQHVAARRAKLVADKQLVAGLGFRIRRHGDPSDAYSVPVHRKPIVPQLPPARSGPATAPEPRLDMAVYEEILETLAGMSVVMERNPTAFAQLDEEALRTHFLVPLNSNFRGLASGETFNAAGKTDILIKHLDRILFVAECKFWKGAQSLMDAISQLLSYMTWRETKAAILLFNRNRDFSAVLQQIPGVFSQHPQFVRREQYDRATGFRFTLRHPSDPQRILTVTVLAFDVPTGV